MSLTRFIRCCADIIAFWEYLWVVVEVVEVVVVVLVVVEVVEREVEAVAVAALFECSS